MTGSRERVGDACCAPIVFEWIVVHTIKCLEIWMKERERTRSADRGLKNGWSRLWNRRRGEPRVGHIMSYLFAGSRGMWLEVLHFF